MYFKQFLSICFLLFNLTKCDEENEFVGKRHFGDTLENDDDFKGEIEFYTTTSNVTQYPEQWAEQRLDHFNPANINTWRQRYFVNFDHFNRSNKKSPIFLEIQGEWTANSTFDGAIVSYAKYYQAAIVKLEHRYYGHSYPTPDASTDNLQYLSSEQALADAASFIEFFKQKYNVKHRKWIIFGCSYAGSLSAWFRLKYIHLVSGAIASSAPVEAILDFDGYLEVVNDVLGPECTEVIYTAIKQLGVLLKNSNCHKMIDKIFGLCEPLDTTNQKDVSNLVSKIVDYFSSIVQYNQNITGQCSRLTAPLTGECALRRVASMIPRKITEKCLDVKYENYVRKRRNVVFKKVDKDNIMRDRLWTYQTCTEFGFFQTTSSSRQPFGAYLPIEFFTDLCVDLFGSKFNSTFSKKAIQITNNFYGGFRIEPTKVVFSNGLIDPWHRLGILKPINPTTTELIIPETAHCFDMHTEREDDPQSLKNARRVIRQKIGQFLSN